MVAKKKQLKMADLLKKDGVFPIRHLRRGDVVEIGRSVVHWHGATPSGEFTHVAVGTNALDGSTVWLESVTDEEYNRFW